jgi:hypothetical protein
VGTCSSSTTTTTATTRKPKATSKMVAFD